MAGGASAERERVAALAACVFKTSVRAVDALAPGLSRRRFYRVRLAGTPGTAIARVDAAEDPLGRARGAAPEPALAEIRALLEAHALPVPKRYGASADIEWLEDLGDTSLCDFARANPRAVSERLTREALDALPRLQRIEDPGGVPAFARRLDRETFAYKAQLFARHSLPLALGRAPRASEREANARAFDFIATLAADAPARLAHRDFQSRNLMVRARGDARELAWIDLQGALLAPPEYDAVCLLRDSYLEWSEPFIAESLERLRARLPDAPARETFELRACALTLSRKAKDHARFLYVASQSRAQDAARVLADLPLTARHLRRAARSFHGRARETDPLCEWLLALPEEARACWG